MLGIEDLRKFMDENKIDGEILTFDKPAMKAEDAERIAGKLPVVKTILLITDKGPVLCILEGRKKIDFEKVKNIMKCKTVRLAKAKEVKEITGYDIGALPPFGHKQKIKTIVDKEIEEFGEVLCGGGSHYSLLRVDSKTLIKNSDYIEELQ
ncbi:MAG: YbaK/EbsC family protein [Candidatus Aenigmarchaeota archaeon]|nr:YbaK/EbsC family protein [Candidatus Aenigmarchaeota archaeon]